MTFIPIDDTHFFALEDLTRFLNNETKTYFDRDIESHELNLLPAEILLMMNVFAHNVLKTSCSDGDTVKPSSIEAWLSFIVGRLIHEIIQLRPDLRENTLSDAEHVERLLDKLKDEEGTS